jgi:hypothetical protein
MNVLAKRTNMLRRIITYTFVGALLFTLSSCDKCQTCVASDEDGVEAYTYPEECGSKKALEAYAEQCATEYGMFDFTCTCSEN